jgi:polar amino acid transport system permease protein
VSALAQSLPHLLRGAVSTLTLAATVLLLGSAGGLALGLARVAPSRVATRGVAAVVELVRAVPLLLLLFFVFFGLPAVGLRMATFPAAVVAMSLWMAANTAEVVRGGVQSIPQGQYEATPSLGLSWTATMRLVVLPQATRRMLPPFVGLCTILVKDTSLAAIIGVFELTRAAQETIERTLRSFEIYGAAAVIYFALCFPLTRFAARLEARLGRL